MLFKHGHAHWTSKKLKNKHTACVVTTVALTGTCLTAAVAVPRDSGDPVAAGLSVTLLAPPTPLVAMVTVAAPDDTVMGFVAVVVVLTDTVWPCFWGITPKFGTILIVVPAFESEDVTVEKVRALSGIVTARAGMRRMAVSQAAFTRVPVVPREADDLAARVSAVADGAMLGAGGEAWGWDTCRVAEMLLLPTPVALLSMSGVSLRVAIMSGVIRSTVWPLASVVIEEGGRRSTSLPWMRKLVAVRGIPVPLWVFTPNWPVIATW